MFKPWVYYATVAATAALLSFTYWLGNSNGKTAVMLEWEADKTRRLEQLNAQIQRNRELERFVADSTRYIIENLSKGNEENERKLQKTLDDMRAGNLRLRNDLRGCQSELSDTTRATGDDHGGDRGGLSEARQRVALRIGADANKFVLKSKACREYGRTIQEFIRKMKDGDS